MSIFAHDKQRMPLKLPTTRYQGSKRRAAPWIYSILKDLGCSSVLDAFGGSGTISYMCKQMGKEVTYNDLLKFNSIIGRALIENDDVTLTESEIDEFAEIDCKASMPGFISNTFKNIYFTDVENQWLDCAIQKIRAKSTASQQGERKVDLIYYSIIQSCLAKRPFNLFHRNNLHLRLSNVVRGFGNKTTWDRPFGATFKKFALELNGLIIKGRHACKAVQCDALLLPDTNFDLVYIDPPYLLRTGNNETANYTRNYHFLEGLVTYGRWRHLIDHESTNKRFKDEDTVWIDEATNSKAFDALFEKYRKSIIVISYKKHGIPSLETLKRKLVRLGKRVKCNSRHYTYALSRQNGCARYNREFLIVAE